MLIILLIINLHINLIHSYYLHNNVAPRNINTNLHASKLSSFLETNLLELTNNTDRGNDISEEAKFESKEIMKALAAGYELKKINPLSEPKLYGNYEVSFVDSGDAQRGNPAGGGFRGKFAKFVFDTIGVYQHILKNPDGTGPIVVNYVHGKALGFITLGVILKGICKPLTQSERDKVKDKYGTQLSQGSVQASFESPMLAIGNIKDPLAVRLGPPSSVILDTNYISDKLRLGLGARGSLFAFRRTENTNSYNWEYTYKKRAVRGRRLGLGILAASTVVFKIGSLIIGKNVKEIDLISKVIKCLRIFCGWSLRISSGLISLVGLLFFSKGGILE